MSCCTNGISFGLNEWGTDITFGWLHPVYQVVEGEPSKVLQTVCLRTKDPHTGNVALSDGQNVFATLMVGGQLRLCQMDPHTASVVLSSHKLEAITSAELSEVSAKLAASADDVAAQQSGTKSQSFTTDGSRGNIATAEDE